MTVSSIIVKPYGAHAVLITWNEKGGSTQNIKNILHFKTCLKDEHLLASQWEFVAAYDTLLIINKELIINF